MVLGSGLAAALPAAGASAATLGTARRSKYIFAVALAHNRVNVSADLIGETFKLRPATARRLFGQLVRNGVVDTPDARGIATLAKPLQRIVPEVVEYNPSGGYVVKGRLDDLISRAKTTVRDVLEIDEDGAPHETGENGSVAIAEPDEPTLSDDDPVPREASTEVRSAE